MRAAPASSPRIHQIPGSVLVPATQVLEIRGRTSAFKKSGRPQWVVHYRSWPRYMAVKSGV